MMRISVAVAIVALALYAATLAPGLTWAHDGDDGGDLAAAVGVGGVPHPPGYPTYLLAGALAAQLPLGELAWRLNWLSALSAALAAGLVCACAIRVTGRRLAGAVAGLAWAFAPVVWSQAVITEVYALNALAVALVAWFAIAQRHAGTRATGVALGLAFGAGLGSGLTLVLCAPLVAWSCGRAVRRWAYVLAGIAAGLLVFAVLPMRAQAQPPVNWGDASTPAGFVWLVTARAYAGLPFGVPPGEWPQRAGALLGLLAQQFTPAGPLLAAWGLARLWRDARAFALAGAVMAGAYTLFATFYAAADSYVHLIPALLPAALWLGGGAIALVDALAAGRTGAVAVVAPLLVLLLPVAQVLTGYGAADVSRDRVATDWLARALESAPPRAVVVSRHDGYTFSLWYARYVQRARADLVVCDRDLWAFDWYRAGLARETGTPLPDGVEIEAAFAGRPVCQLQGAGATGCTPGSAAP